MDLKRKFYKFFGAKLKEELEQGKRNLQSQLKFRLNSKDRLSKYNLFKNDIDLNTLYHYLEYVFQDNWDIQKNCLITRYPEITVTDSNNNKHTIRDFYVKYRISDSSVSMYVKKFLYTYAEYNNKYYLHSHVNDSSGYCFSSSQWCDGICKGDYLNNIYSKVNKSSLAITDKIILITTAMTEFLQEESTANPYTYLSNNATKRDKLFDSVYPNTINFEDLEILDVLSVDDPIEYAFNTDEVIEKHPDYNSFLCYSNQYALDSELIKQEEKTYNVGFYFRSKRVDIKIINSIDIETPKAYVYTGIKDYFNNKFKEYVNKSDFKARIISNYKDLCTETKQESAASLEIVLDENS
jgi:sulfur relay (sulfurtransferase) DsrC/TusE family protein